MSGTGDASGSTLDFFGEPMELGVQYQSYTHDVRFLEVLGLEHLQHVFYNKLDENSIEAITNLLNHQLSPVTPLTDVIWVFVFAHGGQCGDDVIPLAAAHAVSAFSRGAEGMHHRYFERVDEEFEEVASLAVQVRAVPRLDEIRLLHFGGFSLGDLPPVSTMYEFKAKVWGVDDTFQPTNPAFSSAILMDAGRLAGAPAIGLYGDEVYTALLLRDQGGAGAHCGNDSGCKEGTDACVPVPPSKSAGYACESEVNVSDGWISVFTEAIQAGMTTVDEVDFGSVRDFITAFLPRTEVGRRLMATYYLASPWIRRDPEALAVYVEALPFLRVAIHRLVKGEDGDEVVTGDLRQAWTQFAALHQGMKTTAFARVSPVLDWAKLTTKADIMKAFESTSTA